jgi:DNA helicase-2/ATP-dependent DNA helicase PcrA
MDVLDSSHREADRSTHADDLAALESVAALHPEAATFESWLRDLLAQPQAPGDVVLLSTIHKMKGREWDRVIIFGASEGLLPHRLSDDDEGERRIFHVALTRARQQVVILADAAAPSMFLDELDGRSATRTGRAPGRGLNRDAAGAIPTLRGVAGRARSTEGKGTDGKGAMRSRSRGAKRMREEPTVVSALGLTVEQGGHRGEIVELGDVDVVLAVGAARVRVKYGCAVTVEGRSVSLARPADPKELAEAEAADAALRAWRTETARRDKVPAYVIMSDADLAGVASRHPQTLAELASCRGMGPVRLERHGDEILAVLAGSALTDST